MSPPPGGVDLHLHSAASDGLLAPDVLIRRAAREGLVTVALTDHDTAAGLPAAQAAAEATGVALIPAVELTCRVRDDPRGTVHVLAYGIDPSAAPLARAFRTNLAAKQAQVARILDLLRTREKIDIPWEEVALGRGELDYVGRHHIAAVLVRRGHARTRLKAFRRYLRSDRVPSAEVIGAEEALAAISAAGGLAVLAHPTRLDLSRHLSPLCALGLAGVEAYRARVNPAVRERAERLARERGLLLTGGSDWHGHHPEPPLGTWRVPAGVLDPFLRRLAQAAEGRS